jgi:hypothetical protein
VNGPRIAASRIVNLKPDGHFCEIGDLLEVQGVTSEPVSHEILCYAEKIQGIFAIQA